MKKYLILVIAMISLPVFSGTVCIESDFRRCHAAEVDFDTVLDLIEYGESTEAPYSIKVNRDTDSITLKVQGKDALVNTMERMVEQEIPAAARPYVLERASRQFARPAVVSTPVTKQASAPKAAPAKVETQVDKIAAFLKKQHASTMKFIEGLK